MQDKDKAFLIEFKDKEKPSLSCLSKETIAYIGSFLDIKNLSRMSRVCCGSHALFKTSLMTFKAECLLNAVMYGNPTEVKKLIKKRKNSDSECIALKKVRGIEECGRIWKAVSPLVYAAWAGDRELINTLLKTVPKARKIQALEQLQDVMQKGTEHGNHLAPYCSLIQAYDEYMVEFNNWSEEKRDDYWIHEIGQKQYMLPLVGLQQICDPEPFDPLPSFKNPPERKLKLEYSYSPLLPLSSSGIGVRFALDKGSLFGGARRVQDWGMVMGVEAAEVAFRRLCEVRTKELTEIIEQLAKPLVEMDKGNNRNTAKR